jgi:hypothetical protein
MTRREQPPKEEITDGHGGDKSTVRTHPAFGLIDASRGTHGPGGVQLFGSPIKHRTSVSIRIVLAEEHFHLHQSWYHGNAAIVDVELSEAQWASFVSSMNMGQGVPCTIRYMNASEPITPPGIVDKTWRAKVDADIVDTVKRDLEKLQIVKNKIDALVKKRRGINKGDLAEIQTLLLQAVEYAPGHYKFAAESVTKHVEDVVTAAKAEVASFILSARMQYPEIEGKLPVVPQITDDRKPG